MSAEIVQEVANEGVLGTLGINWRLFIAQLVNFAIVLFVLWRWAWKPILRVLDDRSKKIEQSLLQAAKIEEEMRAMGERRTMMLRDAETQAGKVIAEATKIAEEERQSLHAKTRGEVQKILEQAKAAIRAEKEQMVTEARSEVADLVLAVTSKVLEETVDEKRNRKLIEQTLERL